MGKLKTKHWIALCGELALVKSTGLVMSQTTR